METVNVAEIFEKYEGNNPFVLDVIKQYKAKGKISYKQEKAALASIKREAVTLERKNNCLEIETGTGKIVGRVVKMYEQANRYDYGRSTTYKMLVEDVKGYRVYGSVPSSIVDDVECGTKVSLTGKLVQKEKGFGYFSYPKNAEIIADEVFQEYADEAKVLIDGFKAEAPKRDAAEAEAKMKRELMDFLSA